MVVVVTYIRWRKGVKLPRLKMSPTIHSLLHPGWLILICNFEPLVSDVAINNQSSMEIIIVNKICTAFLPFFNLLRQVNAPKKKTY